MLLHIRFMSMMEMKIDETAGSAWLGSRKERGCLISEGQVHRKFGLFLVLRVQKSTVVRPSACVVVETNRSARPDRTAFGYALTWPPPVHSTTPRLSPLTTILQWRQSNGVPTRASVAGGLSSPCGPCPFVARAIYCLPPSGLHGKNHRTTSHILRQRFSL